LPDQVHRQRFVIPPGTPVLAPSPKSATIDVTQPSPIHPQNALWQRLLVLLALAGSGVLCLIAVGVLLLGVLLQKSWFQEWFFTQMTTQSWNVNRAPPPEPRTPYQPRIPEPDATPITEPHQLFVPTNVWTATLRFTEADWAAIQPKQVPRTRGWMRPDGTLLLNNTNAPRPGIAGVFGVSQPWSKSDFDFGGRSFTNVATRFKGNGTFLFSQNAYSRPYKLDFAKGNPDRTFAAQSELNLHNLAADRSLLSDSMGYEFFRNAGVPAPRTTYTRLFVTIEGQLESRFLGLYVVIEDPGETWLNAALQTEGGSLFKPVTMELFHDLGDDWNAYTGIYNPKSKVSQAHQKRLIELCRLVTHASDADFAQHIFEFVDRDALCRYLACETLLANYDGIFSNGQNFLLWIDPRSHRFGFSPWDLDHSWGGFHLLGSADDRLRSSIFHPWVGDNRFFERVFAVPEFQDRYRAELRRLLDQVFIPERLHARVDELADAIRPAVRCMPEERLSAFETAVDAAPKLESGRGSGPNGPVHQLKPFMTRRAAEVWEQLDGRSQGVILTRNPRR